jgi:hypothetical protein
MSKKKKSKRSTLLAIPHLSLDALDAVQKIERYARHELSDCQNIGHFNTQKAERILRTCTVQVLKTQIAYYESLSTFQEKWIIKLQEDAIESAVGMIPGGYGDDLYEYFRNILWKTTYADLNPPKELTAKRESRNQKQPSRLPSTVTSPPAARKLEAYIQRTGIGLTEFATRIGTTDRTLRSFRKTGKIRRSIFEGIAKAMGTTKESLLSD